MGEKPGKVQALVVEFSADCAAIRAKNGEGGYSETVDSWRKGVYTSYTPASLVSIYSVKERGELKEFIRIDKKGDKYFLSEKQSGRWLSSVEVTLISKDDLEKMLNKPISVEFR